MMEPTITAFVNQASKEQIENALYYVYVNFSDWDAYLKENPDLVAAGVNPLYHLLQNPSEGRMLYKLTPRKGAPQPPTPPTPPTGEIKSFQNIDALNDPDNCYFTGCRVNGEMQFATYKDGSYQSKIKNSNGQDLTSFNCESNFMIIPFAGGYNMSQEHGKYSSVDRGMVWRLVNGAWQEVYRHPRWTLITEMYHNPTDGYLYASGCKIEDASDPGGIVRSKDGVNFSVWFENPYEYRFWGMTSRPNGSMVIAATSGGKDWGGECSPSVFEGSNLIWRDDNHRGSGFWAAEYWHNDVYLGRCGDAAVVRLSDKKEVLSMPGYEAIHDLAVDKVTDTLYAFVNGPNAAVKATKDGNNWYTVQTLDIPSIIDGFWDDTEKTMFLCGGQFAGKGRVYKGVR